MRDNRSKYLLKNTAIFTLGNLATKLISFFLIPLYTNVLTTSEYGVIDLVVTIATIVVPLLTCNISEAVMRFNLDKGVEKNEITKIGVIFVFVCAVLGLSLIPLCSLFDEISSLSVYIYFYVLFTASSQIFLCDLRGKELIIKYSFGNIIYTASLGCLNVLFLLVLSWGMKGYLLAYIVAGLITTVFAFFAGKSYKSIFAAFDKKKASQMLLFSVVLIPNSFMWWIMNSSDHLIVALIIGSAANGIYAISYKIPTLISTFSNIFNQAWQYSAIKEEGAVDEEEYNNEILSKTITVAMIVGLGMMTVIKPFLKWYVDPAYHDAWLYTPFLIIGCVYLTIGTFLSTSYTVHKDSAGFLISGVFGAILNLLLNFLLIYPLGVFGVAVSTCVSYVAVFVFRAVHTRKYIKYKVFTKEFVLGSALLASSGVLVFVDSFIGQIIQILLLLFLIFVCRKRISAFIKVIFKRK